MNLIAKFFKTIIGLLLVPAACAFARAFYSQISLIGMSTDVFQAIEGGVVVYLLVHTLVFKPAYIYVLGHELVHVLVTWICGGRVESFKISGAGGNVVTSKTNVFIELSPYFVPVYTLILGPLYILARSFYAGDEVRLSTIFLFLTGLTLAMHFVMTAEVLKMKQQDIARSGFVFSFILIFISNLVVTLGVFCTVFKAISFPDFIREALDLSSGYYLYLYGLAADAWQRIKEYCS